MNISFEVAADDVRRVISGAIVVGYIRREDTRWVLVDHIDGRDVAYSGSAFDSEIKAAAVDYFAARQFCTEGCGRMAKKPDTVCLNCSAMAERVLLCYVRGTYGDIYSVSRVGSDGFRVEVANIDHPAPVVYRAWEVLDNIGKGLYEVVPAAEIAAVAGL